MERAGEADEHEGVFPAVKVSISELDQWFNKVRREFCPLAQRFSGKPSVYVEIGTWAGATCEWVARNVLTHPESLGFGIDPYPSDRRKYDVDEIKQRAANRVSFLGDRWKWHYLPSWHGLPQVVCHLMAQDRCIDLLYIDGDHDAHAVVQDFALAWPVLRPGSVVIFDDHSINRPWPVVREAVESIHLAWKGLIKPIGKHQFQHAIEVVRKDLGNLHSRRHEFGFQIPKK
jgi:hypothetical protein